MLKEVIYPELQNKVVLITGANSGIGSAIAKAFGRQKASVLIHYFNSSNSKNTHPVNVEHSITGRSVAESVAKAVKKEGGKATLVSCDFANAEAIPEFFSEVVKIFGAIDILINNAAHCESPDTLLEISQGTIDRHFAVNVRAPVLLMHEFASYSSKIRKKNRRIVNISTDAARVFSGQIAYGASKAALEAFTRSTAVELGPLGITVNVIAPGPVQTGYITKKLEKKLLPDIPLRRIGIPEDIANAVLFLASNQANWITGQIIQVAGGHAL